MHRASYDLMAPRHLKRRAVLVSTITGAPLPSSPQPAVVDLARPAGPVPAARVAPGATSQRVATARVPRVVDWPTVLLFLGAFLVVVASAIFSIAVWGDLGTVEKFAFMFALTCGFYGAGWWALNRLRLHTGAIALVAVASGMLLFDGWILIDGSGLEGPAPWGALLLVCSCVYFATGLVLGRTFTVAGAAAQVAWWWLLGDALGLSRPAVFAGISLVALVWLLVSERVRDHETASDAATVLAWGAPVLAAGCALGAVVDVVLVGSAVVDVVVSTGVVSGAAGLVLWRSRALPTPVRPWAAAASQIPVIAAVWSAGYGVEHVWWVAVAWVVLALAYDAAGLAARSLPFTVLGLVAEVSAAVEVCLVLRVSTEGTIVTLATLAALWALAARLAGRARGALGPAFATVLATAAEVGAFALLAGCSLALPVAGGGLPVPGVVMSYRDALPYVGVLAAWWAAAAIRPRGHTSYAGSAFSFATLSALLSALSAVDAPTALFATPLVVLAGVWRVSARRVELLHGGSWAEATRWSARASVLLLGAAGLTGAADPARYMPGSGGLESLAALVLLCAAIAVVLALDAVVSRSEPVAAVAGVLAVGMTAACAGAGALVAQAVRPEAVVAIVTSATTLAVVVGCAVLGRGERWRLLAAWCVTPATVAASALLGTVLPLPVWEAAASWAMISVSWVCVAILTSRWVIAAAGITLVMAVWAALGLEPSDWVALAVVGTVGLGFGALSFSRRFGRDGVFADSGASLAIAGVLTLTHLAWTMPVPSQPAAAALLLVGAGVAATCVARAFEPGYYAAGAPLVLAAWTQVALVEGSLAVCYSTPIALYIVLCGLIYVRQGDGRTIPAALDAVAVAVGVGYPLLVSVQAAGQRGFSEALATVGISLAAIGAGVAWKVRWYFFGGVAALAAVAFYRSFSAIAEYWWLVLGVVGVALLVVALTWQRQRMFVSDARSWLARSFDGWR